ncbi:MAG: lysozyme [Elusimicrobia bacterium]|nr:lysozyme [Elusimicrobiota bacterium]
MTLALLASLVWLAPAHGAPRAVAKAAPKAVWGIDVSHHQGRIRWDQLRGQGLSFVYMKATEGDYMADHSFLENWQGAARAGLVRGAYHFYDLCGKGATQAAEFIKLVPRSPGSLPPAIDLEPSDHCERLPSRKALLKELSAYARKVRGRYGKAPVVYLNYEFYDRYLKGRKHGWLVWIVDYKDRPKLPDGRPWTFWQVSNKASLRGIKGPVDVDIFRGSAAQFVFLGKPVPALFAQR